MKEEEKEDENIGVKESEEYDVTGPGQGEINESISINKRSIKDTEPILMHQIKLDISASTPKKEQDEGIQSEVVTDEEDAPEPLNTLPVPIKVEIKQ